MEDLTYQDLLGKKILIGVTYYTEDDTFIEQKQFWGAVIEANENGILVKKKDGTIFSLPPPTFVQQSLPPRENIACVQQAK